MMGCIELEIRISAVFRFSGVQRQTISYFFGSVSRKYIPSKLFQCEAPLSGALRRPPDLPPLQVRAERLS